MDPALTAAVEPDVVTPIPVGTVPASTVPQDTVPTGPRPEGTGASAATAPARSVADQRMRRLLRLPVDAPRQSIFDAESIFGRSIAISAIRCLVTYVFLPLLAPVVNLSGSFGPILGLTLGAVSMFAIVLSMRRFFAADHKWRWGYASVGAAILVALVIAGVADIANLLG